MGLRQNGQSGNRAGLAHVTAAGRSASNGGLAGAQDDQECRPTSFSEPHFRKPGRGRVERGKVPHLTDDDSTQSQA